MSFLSVGLLAIAAFLPGGELNTWIVDGAGGGDFLSIQSAVDIATNGDLILVRPGSSYGSFEINGKGVIVMSESPTENFEVSGDLWPLVVIKAIDANTGVAGVVGARSIGVNGGFYVLNCSGEVVLEDVTAEGGFGDSALSEVRLTIDGCDNVSVTSSVFTGTSSVAGGGNGILEAAVQITNSLVRMHDVFVRGSGGVDGEFCLFDCGGLVNAQAPGETGLSAADSTLFLSDSQILGGQGGSGSTKPVNFFEIDGGVGSDGGTGLIGTNSTIFCVGANESDDVIQGGTGGNAGDSDVSCPMAGDGADALALVNTTLFASRVNFVGGLPGHGCLDGSEGEIGATVTVDDNYPLFDYGALQLGANITFDSNGVHPGNSVLFFSVATDPSIDGLPNYGGPPLSLVSPGALGLPGGDFSLPITVPDANSLLGSVFHFQVALNGGPGANHVSNAVSRIVRP